MVYHPVKLNLSKAQCQNLAKGKTVQLSPSHLRSGTQQVHLTKTQVNRLHRAAKSGAGVRLQLSHPQLRHHARHGKGFFGDLLKNTGKNLINTVGKDLLNKGVSKLADFGAKKGGIVGTLANLGANTLSQVGDKVIDKANEKLGGSGIRLTKANWNSAVTRAKKHHKLKGGSIKTHIRRELGAEIKKKVGGRRKSAGSKVPRRGKGPIGNILGQIVGGLGGLLPF